MNNPSAGAITPSLAPWLTVADGGRALAFYQAAFNAVVMYRLEPAEAGFVIRLAVDAAEWWISEEPDSATIPLGGPSLRLILTVSNPDQLFRQAVAAGATEIFPVGEEHGWRLGRLCDPFGLHWEIGHPISGH